MVEDFMGVQSGYKGVTTNDIPSDLNQIYRHPVDDDGGLSPRQGIFADTVREAHAATTTPDRPTAGKDMQSLIVIGVALAGLFVIFKVLK